MSKNCTTCGLFFGYIDGKCSKCSRGESSFPEKRIDTEGKAIDIMRNHYGTEIPFLNDTEFKDLLHEMLSVHKNRTAYHHIAVRRSKYLHIDQAKILAQLFQGRIYADFIVQSTACPWLLAEYVKIVDKWDHDWSCAFCYNYNTHFESNVISISNLRTYVRISPTTAGGAGGEGGSINPFRFNFPVGTTTTSQCAVLPRCIASTPQCVVALTPQRNITCVAAHRFYSDEEVIEILGLDIKDVLVSSEEIEERCQYLERCSIDPFIDCTNLDKAVEILGFDSKKYIRSTDACTLMNIIDVRGIDEEKRILMEKAIILKTLHTGLLPKSIFPRGLCDLADQIFTVTTIMSSEEVKKRVLSYRRITS